MATILLSAAGAAIGSGFGGTVLGLSGAVIGRAVGATLGRAIDQKILGAGSDAVEVGRVERFRLTGASEGTPVTRVWGRVRLAGQVIWATRFRETVTESGGGKGTGGAKTSQFSYSVSLAIALCEGEIRRVGRIWADGNEISTNTLNMRIYKGGEAQLPDPKIEAVEGAGKAPAYRGIAYVVIEDLDLAAFGNRVPQFSFEVVRGADPAARPVVEDLAATISGVCMIPGTGEYALATTPVHYAESPGVNRTANMNMPTDQTDFALSLEQLGDEMPGVGAVSLVVSWFGDDLRCGQCTIRPKVEQKTLEGVGMSWRSGGISRAAAEVVPQVGGRSIYGGTPADQAVIEAIQALTAAGKAVTFYPFILMDQLEANRLQDPWTESADQPKLPWRGRITTSIAPGRAGTPDRTELAETEVAAFFGTAQGAHFSVSGTTVSYAGPAEWSYRRFVLHNAHLCAAAGGVEAFCIGSELRGLTQVRGEGDSFPAVAALIALAADVRAILGPGCKLSYAADWSEYFGYHTDDNVYFHLDPLWADANIDFIGIDNYMPLSDWREGETHADSGWKTLHDPAYLQANIAGGEGFDWYYASEADAATQTRTAITDGAYGEPWVYRYKDLRNWWTCQHHPRIGGVRQALPTAWVPQSKPFRFTEYGCAAIDKGSNQPNKFLDPKSSESALPSHSTGQRDDLMQMAYHTAMARFWREPANNPTSLVYSAPMLDFDRSLAWAWDARPFPVFPVNQPLWDDGANFETGHWLNGRSANQSLAAVIAEVCERSGLPDADTDQALGVVRGYGLSEVTSARALLQPVLQAASVDAVEREGILSFLRRTGLGAVALDPAGFAEGGGAEAAELGRLGEAEMQDHLRLIYLEAESDFAVRAVAASLPDAVGEVVAQTDLPLALTNGEAASMAERWLVESRLARDTLRFSLPPSMRAVGAGSVVELDGKRYRIDRCELTSALALEAVRIDPAVYRDPRIDPEATVWKPYQPPTPPFPVFLDLPLLTGSEKPHVPHVAIAAAPWPGQMAIWSSATEAGFAVNTVVERPAFIGVTETDLPRGASSRWERGPALRLRLGSGNLSSAEEMAVLAGANAIAIGDGSSDTWEIIQFRDAALVAPSTYEVTTRLRGQMGTDGVMPDLWPAGSLVVVLDTALKQISLPQSARGLSRNYRIGDATRGYDAPGVVARSEAFSGIGLRPYSVCHPRKTGTSGADVAIRWIRRTRMDGDSWQSLEVPLGEETESYRVQIRNGAALLREVTTSQPSWTYTAAMQGADGAGPTTRIEVAQLSASFGAGPSAELALG
ncbi:baseplate multidomain protein megatron [Tabrizicola oligotrophica]|uniref:Host specificity protein n=1 Tax=Tabrizicola oligotrophica TaxID=2710650 RepID=A0A6M0QP76_9RHOB|nr:glycoside hydrolase TIM-barrel-like domain-containing protein [Tabrizicola oligotrophica]NEY89288.1 host specificity protein [Tabrizicola oligotrophica]